MRKLLCIITSLSLLISSTGIYASAYTPTDVTNKNCINIDRLKEEDRYSIKKACNCKTCTVQIYKYSELPKLLEQLEKQMHTSENKLVKAINAENKKNSKITKVFLFDATKNVIKIIDKITPENWNVVKSAFNLFEDEKYTVVESVTGKFIEKVVSIKLDPTTAKKVSDIVKNSLHYGNKIGSAYQWLTAENPEKCWVKYYNSKELLDRLSMLIKNNAWVDNNYILISVNDDVDDADAIVQFRHSDIVKYENDFSKEFEEASKKVDNILAQIKSDNKSIPKEEELFSKTTKLALSASVVSKIAYLCADGTLSYEDIIEKAFDILGSFFKATNQAIDLTVDIACKYEQDKEACLVKKIVDTIRKNPEEYKIKD